MRTFRSDSLHGRLQDTLHWMQARRPQKMESFCGKGAAPWHALSSALWLWTSCGWTEGPTSLVPLLFSCLSTAFASPFSFGSCFVNKKGSLVPKASTARQNVHFIVTTNASRSIILLPQWNKRRMAHMDQMLLVQPPHSFFLRGHILSNCFLARGPTTWKRRSASSCSMLILPCTMSIGLLLGRVSRMACS